jgi:hypothetical protein
VTRGRRKPTRHPADVLDGTVQIAAAIAAE